jgi:hypothetical protein
MNTLVSLPIIAAVPTTAPAMPPDVDQSADPIFAAIDAYRKADPACIAVNGEAISVVMRTHPTTPAGLAALTSWARERADWLRANGTEGGGNFCTVSATIDDAARGMSGLKAWSPPAAAMAENSGGDCELLTVAEKYIAAEAEHSRLVQIHNDLEDAFLTEGKPAALRVRHGDVDLGIRAFMGRLGEDHGPIAVYFLRGEQWPHPEAIVDVLRGEWVVDKWMNPTPEARKRADEIITAYDLWQKTRNQKKTRKITVAKRKQDKAGRAMVKLEERLAEMPATSIVGLIAKARCAAVYEADCQPESDDPLGIFGASIVRDLLELQREQAAAARPITLRALANSPNRGLPRREQTVSSD